MLRLYSRCQRLPPTPPGTGPIAVAVGREVIAWESIDLADFSNNSELVALILFGVEDCIAMVP